MSPFRLIVLLFLFYLLYRLLTGGRQGSGKKMASSKDSSPLTHDVLVEDPVCHTYIPQGQAVTWRKNGSTLHFCSEKCKEKYIAAHSEN